MSSNTPNLKLYKVNPKTDGNNTFNIDTMLNDNWDKIDGAMENVSSQMADFEVKVENNKVDLTNQNLNIVDLAIELETLKSATLTGVNANIVIETFQTINDINLKYGMYDDTNNQIYLSNIKINGFGFCFE